MNDEKLSQHDIDAFVAAQHAEIYGYVENIPADALLLSRYLAFDVHDESQNSDGPS